MTCPNQINKTMLISFPRSGHHLMVRGLIASSRHRIVYSENYQTAHNMLNCEFVNLQKDHDFNLSLEVDPDMNYIVLIRDFAACMKSWHLTTDMTVPLQDFMDQHRAYYDGFIEKWSEYKPIRYEQFVLNKLHTVCSVSAQMGFEPDMRELERWVRGESR